MTLRFAALALFLIPAAAAQHTHDHGHERPAAALDARPSPMMVANVIDTVNHLFNGMRARDSSAVRDVMHSGAYMATIATGEDGAVLRHGNVEQFIAAVGQAPEPVLDERIDGIDIRIDGAMAFVWTPYRFYVGERFSHCGANAIVMIREPRSRTGWLITSVTDTRRTEGCERDDLDD